MIRCRWRIAITVVRLIWNLAAKTRPSRQRRKRRPAVGIPAERGGAATAVWFLDSILEAQVGPNPRGWRTASPGQSGLSNVLGPPLVVETQPFSGQKPLFMSRRSGGFVSPFKPSSVCSGSSVNQGILPGTSRRSRREHRAVSFAKAPFRLLRASGTLRAGPYRYAARRYRSFRFLRVPRSSVEPGHSSANGPRSPGHAIPVLAYPGAFQAGG